MHAAAPLLRVARDQLHAQPVSVLSVACLARCSQRTHVEVGDRHLARKRMRAVGLSLVLQ